ncbi:MAG: DOMON-like domain-containing protein [Proteobacteria bacterium]|nr:DOMON-like domain-containing protein [Pseudomonadota bacterium]
MRVSLTPHPDTPCAAVTRLSVDVVRDRRGRLILSYVGEIASETLLLPTPVAPDRTDGLWRHTCFEMFVRISDQAYVEVNLSPSTQWAAYIFDDYREGMSVLEIMTPRIMTTGGRPPRYELRASVDLSSIPALAAAKSWQLALTAVIEETDGAKSYWALKHPPGKPDFHHVDGFALELP